MRATIVLGFLALSIAFAIQAQPTITVKTISARGSHSLALTSDGAVWTWGCNVGGQLGDETTTNRFTPVRVSGLTGVTAVAGGNGQSLALKSDGTVWAWGRYEWCTVGGPSTGASTASQVGGINGVAAVAGGGVHSLALKTDGTVWAWGTNAWGNLGDGTFVSRAAPVRVSGLTAVTAIAGGSFHSLAARSDGTVWAWGNNWYGQLGNGVIDPIGFLSVYGTPAPIQVSGLIGIVAVAGGYGHSLALKNDGTVWAWGHNGGGQLGDGTTIIRSTPVQVGVLTGVVAIAVGDFRSLALKNDGTVWVWGWDGRSYNSQGDGLPIAHPTPEQVNGLGEALAVTAGSAHNLVLKADGTIWGWGSDYWGELGDGAVANRTAPGRVAPLTGLTAVAAGGDRSLALNGDGTVWSWGYDFWAGGTPMIQTVPTPVRDLSEVVEISAGVSHGLALKYDGTVWEWEPANTTPIQVNGLTKVVHVAAGETTSLAAKSDGTVWQWSGPSTPVQVNDLSEVVAVAIAVEWWWDELILARKLALKQDGTVWVWDEGGSAEILSPIPVAGLTGIVTISGGLPCTAVKDDGTVWEWDYASPPAQRAGLSGIKAVVVGGGHSLALKSDGTIWAWGDNRSGQLGDGTTTATRTIPVQVAGLSEVTSIAAGSQHSLALKKDGTPWAWGSNQYGQLGDEKTTTFRLTPVQVIPPGSPDLAIAMSHVGNFNVGGQGLYTLTVTNIGARATSSTITVTDILSPGLTYLFASGSGWTCSTAEHTVICSNPGSVNPGTSSTITLTVDVGSVAYPGVTNLATVSNASDLNSSNNTIGDPTVILQF